MVCLRQSDLTRLSDATLALYAGNSPEKLIEAFVESMRILLDADRLAVNWIDRKRLHAIAYNWPVPSLPVELEAFNAHVEQHPSLSAIQQPENSPVVKWSDFTTLRQFRHKALYHDYFRVLGTNHQLAMTFLADPNTTVGTVFNRQHTDFTEEDRTLLKLMAPHFRQVYQQAQARGEMERALALRDACLVTEPVMWVTEDGTVSFQTDAAARLCHDLFGKTSGPEAPPELLCWLRKRPQSGSSWSQVCQGRRVQIRCVTFGKVPGTIHPLGPISEATPLGYFLRFEAAPAEPSAEMLRALNLTERETEVLLWMAQGKRNSEIAIILGAKTRTIDKHVENILRKLNVENRSAAVALAWAVLNDQQTAG